MQFRHVWATRTEMESNREKIGKQKLLGLERTDEGLLNLNVLSFLFHKQKLQGMDPAALLIFY